MRSRPWLCGLSLASLGILLVLAFIYDEQSSEAGPLEFVRESARIMARLPLALDQSDSAQMNNQGASATHGILSRKEALEIQNRQYAALRFEDSSIDAFSLPIVTKGLCAPELSAALNFGDFILGRMKSTQDQLPLLNGDEVSDTLHIEEAALFFKNHRGFIQIHAHFAGGKPGAYRVTGLVFKDADFSSEPRVFKHSAFDSRRLYDALSVREIFGEIFREFGDVRVYQRLSLLDGQSRVSARFFGKLPVTLSSDTEECSLDTVESLVTCLCSVSGGG